jgi:hypothetical protein
MDPSGLNQLLDVSIVIGVFSAQVVCEVEKEFSAKDFIAMHVGNVLELWLHCGTTESL